MWEAKVASVLPSRLQDRFEFRSNPIFKSAFALPGGYIIVSGGLLAIAPMEDESANMLGHEIEHVEPGQVSRRVRDTGKAKRTQRPGAERVSSGLYQGRGTRLRPEGTAVGGESRLLACWDTDYAA